MVEKTIVQNSSCFFLPSSSEWPESQWIHAEWDSSPPQIPFTQMEQRIHLLACFLEGRGNQRTLEETHRLRENVQNSTHIASEDC